jgi:uncharacterized protein (TIGR02117 family)
MSLYFRRRSRRVLIALLRVLFALGALWGLAGCAVADRSPPPRAEACVLAAVSSNGWHAGFYLPAETFPEDGALRAAFPDAAWFAIGWGDARAYPRLGVYEAVSSIAWPTPSVLHVAAMNRDPRGAYRQDYRNIALSTDQAARLAADIEAELALREDGQVDTAGPGLDPRGSAFLKARSRYHALNTCNVWIARRLEDAGVETGWSGGHLLPASLLRALSRRAPEMCGAT